MLSYPARLARSGDRFMVSLPDIPEALTGAPSRDEALEMAADALTTAMDFYFEAEGRCVGEGRALRAQLSAFVSPHTESACPEIVAARGLARKTT